MTKYRVCEIDPGIESGPLNPRYFETPEQVAEAMLGHQMRVAEIDAANKILPPGARQKATSLEITAITFGLGRRLNLNEERAILNCFNELAGQKKALVH